MKPWKKLHLKSNIKCFKEVKIDKWPDLFYSFLPIHCCVRINGVKPYHLISGDIQSYISWERQHKFQNFCIPGCLLVHLNNIIQHRHQSSNIFFNRSSTMLNNVFKPSESPQHRPNRSRYAYSLRNICFVGLLKSDFRKIQTYYRISLFSLSLLTKQSSFSTGLCTFLKITYPSFILFLL